MKTFLFSIVLSTWVSNVWAQSGNLGNGLTWLLDKTTLSIIKTGEGSGKMPDYNRDENSLGDNTISPWFEKNDDITTVVVGEGVTSIGYMSFYLCSMSDIILPSTLQTIGDLAFGICASIRGEFVIPANVTSISETAFNSCLNITSFAVDKNNKNYKSINGVLFNKNGSSIIIFPPGRKQTYNIPDGVTTIGNHAFNSSQGLSSELSIPEGVTTIGNSAFYNCFGITRLSLPSTLTDIGSDAFSNCHYLSLINVDEKNTNYKSIDGVLFNKDGSRLILFPLKKTGAYNIPDGVTTIGDNTFANSNITGITIPDGIKAIGNTAFINCRNIIDKITIPASVTTIGNQAFFACPGITAITIKNPTPPTIGFGTFGLGEFIYIKDIYVPNGSEKAYKSAPNWSEYTNLIKEADF